MTIRKNINELGKNTAIYGIGNTLNKFAAFLLIPLYTRYLLTADVGVFALLEMFEKLMIAIAPLGVVQATWRYITKQSGNDKSQIIFSGFIWTLVLNIIILSLLILVRYNLIPLFGLSESTAYIFLLVVLNIFLSIGSQFLLSLWQYNNKAFSFIILSLVKFSGILIVSVFLVAYHGQGLFGLIFAKTIVLAVVFIFSMIIMLKDYKSCPKISVFITLLKFGAPLILLGLVAPMLTLSSRAYLRVFVTLEEIGIYFIGFKFGMLINMFLVVPLQRSWVPMMFKLGTEKSALMIHRDVMYYYTIIGFSFCVGLILFIEPLLSFIAQPQYLAGAPLVPVIAFAYFISGYRLFFMAGAALRDRTPRIALAAGVAVLANIILNYYFIKYFGTWGAAWATLLSYIVLVVAVFTVSNKLIKIEWLVPRLFKVTAVTLTFILVIYLTRIYIDRNYWILSIIEIFVYFCLLFAFKIIDRREINGFKSIIKKFTQI